MMNSMKLGWVGVAAASASVTSLVWVMARRLEARRRRRQSIQRVAESFVPGWRPGEPQAPPFPMGEVLTIAPESLPSKYNFFISAFIPRPIALVSSVSDEGEVNLAPFSYSGIANHDPGVVFFSAVTKGREGGDTLKNVKATEQFVVHVMSEWYLEAANHSCGNFAPEVNEFREAGLTEVPSILVRPPRVAEAALAMECRVLQLIPLANDQGAVTSTMVIGKVVLVHVNKAVYDQDKGVVIPEALRPMARLGGNTYATIGDIFDLARPKV